MTSYARQRSTLAHRARLYFTAQTPLRVRAMLRLAQRRASLALGIAIVAGSALGSAAAATTILAVHAVHSMELHATVAPLAPAPAPPSPPILPVKRHRLFHINPLAGLASWYGSVWNGRKTASGETFDEHELTAAHNSLPLGTVVRVTNLRSMRSVIVRINDRGTLAPNRIIDLSSAAAREIGMVEQGLARVKLEVIGRS